MAVDVEEIEGNRTSDARVDAQTNLALGFQIGC